MPVWTRLFVLLSFLAVLWAQAGPLAMRGQEVHAAGAMTAVAGSCHQADSHGAACPVAAPLGNPHTDSASLHHASRHCDLCASLGWVFPALAVCAIPCFAGEQVAAADVPADTSAAVAGLPFGRGPPFHLN